LVAAIVAERHSARDAGKIARERASLTWALESYMESVQAPEQAYQRAGIALGMRHEPAFAGFLLRHDHTDLP